MKLERLRKDYKNKVIIGGLIFLGLTSVLIFIPSMAKYKVTQSVKVGTGTVNYKVPDFQIISMYQSEDGSNYTEITTMSGSDYVINENESYCSVNNVKDESAVLKTINGEHSIGNLQKGSKCFLYFDKYVETITISDIIADSNVTITNGAFKKIAKTDEGLVSINDGDGISYIYRGAVTNNYVKFANKCWRIIRINGDGAIRLIYDGSACHANGTSTTDSLINASLAYNTEYSDNSYVGYMHGLNNTGTSLSYSEAHANIYDSTIKVELDSWYDNNLKIYENKIDKNAGFCNDRKISTVTYSSSYGTLGYGKNGTVYAPTSRIINSSWNYLTTQTPTLECAQKNDDFFTPITSNKGNKMLSRAIGLITMDEVIFAGGFGGSENNQYYLYNGQYYWTMSPYDTNINGIARVFYVNNNGRINFANQSTNSAYGVRPVINLRSDTTFKAVTNGTKDNPYEVI